MQFTRAKRFTSIFLTKFNQGLFHILLKHLTIKIYHPLKRRNFVPVYRKGHFNITLEETKFRIDTLYFGHFTSFCQGRKLVHFQNSTRAIKSDFIFAPQIKSIRVRYSFRADSPRKKNGSNIF